MASSSFLSLGKFLFIAFLVLRYLAIKSLLLDRKDNSVEKLGYFLRK